MTVSDRRLFSAAASGRFPESFLFFGCAIIDHADARGVTPPIKDRELMLFGSASSLRRFRNRMSGAGLMRAVRTPDGFVYHISRKRLARLGQCRPRR